VKHYKVRKLHLPDLSGCPEARHPYPTRARRGRARRPAPFAELDLGDALPAPSSLGEPYPKTNILTAGRCVCYKDVGSSPGAGILSLASGMPLAGRGHQQSARRRGGRKGAGAWVSGGRPPLDTKGPRVQMARSLHKDREHEVRDICQSLHISRSTLYRYLAMPT
jgi:hypothetical protein